jgi:hypothetical protein
MVSDRAPKVGWEFLVWDPRRPHKCNVPSCRKEITAGWVRVDNVDAKSERFVSLCTDCYNLIRMGVDPDPAAVVPAWEEENREKRLREAMQ